MPIELTKELLELAFDDLGRLSRERGLIAEIAVYGGACLLLASDIRDVTRDVDSVFIAEPDFLYEAADRIAKLRNLPKDWLNQSVAFLVGSPGNTKPRIDLFGEYPRDQGLPGLRVFLPAPEYILAMKLIASRRDDMDGAARDQRDIAHLMQITKRRTSDALMQLVKEFFPGVPGISNRVLAKIDDALKYEQENRVHVERRATWNNQRSRGQSGIG